MPTAEQIRHSHDPSRESSPTPSTSVAIDLGTTRLKVELIELSELTIVNQAETDYFPHISRIPGLHKFKWIDGAELLPEIYRLIYRLTFTEDTPQLDLCVCTGLSNSLAVTAKTGNEDAKIRILFDEPSAKTEFTPQQQDILREYIGDDFDKNGLKISTSLMKILTLKNHPEMVKYLFGTDVTFERLTFNTFVGLVSELMAGKSLGVPFDDRKGFAGRTVNESDNLSDFLQKLGITPDQLRFMPGRKSLLTPENDIGRSETVYFFNIHDVVANVSVIEEYIKQGKLPKDGLFVELDTIFKIIFSDASTGVKLGKQVGDMRYITERYGARINPDIMYWLVNVLMTQEDQGRYYKTVERIIAERIDEIDNPYLYYPEAETLGRLYKSENGNYHEIEVSPQSLNRTSFSAEELKKITRAMARGTFFNLRYTAEDLMSVKNLSGNDKLKFFIYAGLTEHQQSAWRQTFAQCFPGQTFYLNMPNAAVTANIMACIQHGFKDKQSIPPLPPPELIIASTDRENDYLRWRVFK